MANGRQFATVPDWHEEFFAEQGHFKFLTPHDVQGKEEMIEVAYTGMGFMLVRRGVFEAMTYPWFRPLDRRIGDMVDFTSEDVGFCLRAREDGYAVWIDPKVRVGHEKPVVL